MNSFGRTQVASPTLGQRSRQSKKPRGCYEAEGGACKIPLRGVSGVAAFEKCQPRRTSISLNWFITRAGDVEIVWHNGGTVLPARPDAATRYDAVITIRHLLLVLIVPTDP